MMRRNLFAILQYNIRWICRFTTGDGAGDQSDYLRSPYSEIDSTRDSTDIVHPTISPASTIWPRGTI